MLLLEDYQCLIDEEAVLDYLVLKGHIKDKGLVTNLRQLLDELHISEYNLRYADELKDLFIDCQRCRLSKERQLELAIKYRMFISVGGELLSPDDFASNYNSRGYGEQNYRFVDPGMVIHKKQIKINELLAQIKELEAMRDAIDTSKPAEFRIEDKHIKHNFCFSNYTERFKYLTEYYGDDSDFWCGTDRKNGYWDEMAVTREAIEAQTQGQEKISWELCTGTYPYFYNFFVSELLSQERVDMLYKDFEMLKAEMPDYFAERMEDNKDDFVTVYNYLCAHHSEGAGKQNEN